MDKPMTVTQAVDILANAVQRGMTFLDEVTPDWLPRVVQEINNRTFDVGQCQHCALSTAARMSYYTAADHYGMSDERTATQFGFYMDWDTRQADAGLLLFHAYQEGLAEYLKPLDRNDNRIGRWLVLTLAWEWAVMERLAEQTVEA